MLIFPVFPDKWLLEKGVSFKEAMKMNWYQSEAVIKLDLEEKTFGGVGITVRVRVRKRF